jgi:16S rRNA (cytidine1402-2'-O)-methyltransferase
MAKLYLVPTPIGNLKDITFRALDVLREADVVFAEDTRKTGILLKHYQVEKKMIPYHQHNEHKVLEKMMEIIRVSATTALVTDAGTPGISDPGFLLIRACLKEGIDVECLPGATSLIPALVQSGLPSDRFIFLGFLPHKKGRNTKLEEMKSIKTTMVLFESPHRLLKTLGQLSDYLGHDRQACVCRELTKLYEENVRGTLQEIHHHFDQGEVKGECVIVISGAD